MTSALAAARLVKQQGLDGGRGAFVMGTDDLRRLVEEHGTPVVPAEVCGAVVVGYDPNFTMSGVVPPMRAVLRGARFVACNREANYPGPGGLLLPGCGAAVGALEGATLKPVDTEVGKPNPLMLDLLLETLGRSRDDCVYFGDTLDSDMAMARRAGVPSVWLNGNGQPRRSNAGEHERPDVVAPDLASLAARWAGV